ncbi:hypothetical protein VCHA53O466_50329 [Vibrio chagasii]|nr:hypothetical protein VCHA53O466_50329 [Vibrio chagasii]
MNIHGLIFVQLLRLFIEKKDSPNIGKSFFYYLIPPVGSSLCTRFLAPTTSFVLEH